MDIEILRTFIYVFSILGPMWIIGPLMRRGLRYWYLLIAIFLLFAYVNYCVYAYWYGTDGGLLRALGLAGFVMVLSYIWAVVANKNEADKNAAPASANAE